MRRKRRLPPAWRGSGWTVLAAVFAVPSAAAAQPREPPPPAPDGTTELSIFSEDPGLAISILPPGEDPDWRVFPDTVPGNAKPLCTTPCDLRIAPGDYVLFAGGHEFEVSAAGGRQQWIVEDANGWMFLGGIFVTSIGITGMLFGALFMALAHLSDPADPEGLLGGQIGLGLGVPLTVLGGLLWGLSYGSDEPLHDVPVAGR